MNDPRWLVLDGTTLPDKRVVGGKAWSIARMRQLGLPVPPAFCLTTEVCREFHDAGQTLPADVDTMVRDGVAWLEEQTDRVLGATARPLLVSVRSGAAVSMPGMMDTVLNLGMNEKVEAALAAETADPAYARDTHCRFCEQYTKIVLGSRLYADADADPTEMRRLAVEECGRPIPEDPYEQLHGAVAAVFDSWHNPRARAYREHWQIDADGTAVTVQAMVFGNLDERSGTGVLFTRNPLNGDREPYGEYLPGGQGEDVVSGEYDPEELSGLADRLPDVHAALIQAGRTLEEWAHDAQDVEFTVQQGQLYLLQTRTAKRSPDAAVRMAVDMVEEGVIDEAEALRRVTTAQIRTLLRPTLAPEVRETAEIFAEGHAACPGVASGVVVADPDVAEERARAGESVVLARPTTSPDDVHGMIAAQGVITEQGGATSHAAVVSRALGRPCVVGCGPGALQDVAGEKVTLDGSTGKVFAGDLPTRSTTADEHPGLSRLLQWAEEHCPVQVLGPDDPDVTEDLVDLDEQGVDDPAHIPRAVRGHTGVCGGALATDEGVRAAVDAGATVLVTTPRLPALLAALPPPGPDDDATSPYQ